MCYRVIPADTTFDLHEKESGKHIAILWFESAERVRWQDMPFDVITCHDKEGETRKFMIMDEGGGEATVLVVFKGPDGRDNFSQRGPLYVIKPWFF